MSAIVLEATTAAEYLRAKGLVGTGPVMVRELTGGVSNAVLFVQPTDAESFVLKQARPQLRVAEEWLCPVERIFVEIDVLRELGGIVGGSSARLKLEVPRLLFEDRENYCYAMSAVDPAVPTWKEVLLSGRAERGPAIAAGTLLGLFHAKTWQRPNVAAKFADRQYFEMLRVDPYYRHVQRNFPELHEPLDELIASLAANELCLVHGDFSPKNLLLSADTLTLLDFEVGHFGDPAFDVGFFFTHLVLKWLWSGGKDQYQEVVATAAKAYEHQLRPQIGDEAWTSLADRSRRTLGGCLLARIDGKSRVDYLSGDQQSAAREWGKMLLCGEVPDNCPRVL